MWVLCLMENLDNFRTYFFRMKSVLKGTNWICKIFPKNKLIHHVMIKMFKEISQRRCII